MLCCRMCLNITFSLKNMLAYDLNKYTMNHELIYQQISLKMDLLQTSVNFNYSLFSQYLKAVRLKNYSINNLTRKETVDTLVSKTNLSSFNLSILNTLYLVKMSRISIKNFLKNLPKMKILHSNYTISRMSSAWSSGLSTHQAIIQINGEKNCNPIQSEGNNRQGWE